MGWRRFLSGWPRLFIFFDGRQGGLRVFFVGVDSVFVEGGRPLAVMLVFVSFCVVVVCAFEFGFVFRFSGLCSVICVDDL